MKVETEVTGEQGRVFVIRINRPHKRNCVDGKTADLLSQPWKRFRDEDALWVVFLRRAT
jgi:enoyl-CoA hydratase/carnithine racemase